MALSVTDLSQSRLRARAEAARARIVERRRLAEAQHEAPEAIPDAAGWQEWVNQMFPATLRLKSGRRPGFASHHAEFWDWAWSIRDGERPRGFVAIWPRGGGKSSSVEMAVAMLAATGRRHYALYVCRTQRQANDHVQSIAGKLESAAFVERYPSIAAKAVSNVTGSVKGWSRSRILTASGFGLEAIGLDAAIRGVKYGDIRPDLIVLDDIDNRKDGPGAVEKNLTEIKTGIIPTGSDHVAIMAAQNLIHSNSIFSKLYRGEADMMVDAIISGPHPALLNPVIDYRDHPEIPGRRQAYFVSGTPTWQGQDLRACQRIMDDVGFSTFLTELQHQVDKTEGSIFQEINLDRLVVGWDEVPSLVRVVCWCDPAVTAKDQSDSNGIIIAGIDESGTIYILWCSERRAKPLETLKLAILKSIEYGAEKVGVETDQGGDTWQDVYWRAAEQLQKDGEIPEDSWLPQFAEDKAGAGYGPKVQRGQQLLTEYERDVIRHRAGTHLTLHSALGRFPIRKPFDLVDAEFWAVNDLAGLREIYSLSHGSARGGWAGGI